MAKAKNCLSASLACLTVFCTAVVGFSGYKVVSAALNESDNTVIADTFGGNSSVKEIPELEQVNSINSRSGKITVSVGGKPFGIKLYTDGVIIVGCENVVTDKGAVNPAELAGLRNGDVITHINAQRVMRNSEVSSVLSQSSGENIVMTVRRGSETLDINFKTVLCVTDGAYKAGLWIRDSSAGIGTLSFYDAESGLFCGLGHGVCDIDTGELLPLYEGEAVGAKINDIIRGSQGATGELSGTFTDDEIGPVFMNRSDGVYGIMKSIPEVSREYEIANISEITEGPAQIITTLDANGAKSYDIEITKVNKNSTDSKDLVIKVTDASLIAQTGGIVRGMSGSPIIKDGKLIGVVTHVFVNDPTGGYGIFAVSMYNTMMSQNSETKRNAA